MLALAGLGAVASGPVFATGMTVDTKGGIEVFELDENNYWFKIGGRLFFDQAFFDADDDDSNDITFNSAFPSGAHIRRARVSLKGGVGHSWVYKFDIDLKDRPGIVRADIGEAFIGYAGCKNLWFAVGQVSIPFGLENWQSANDSQFMEMSMTSQAFAPDRGLGLYGEWHGNYFTASAAVYHPQIAGSRQTGDVLASPTQVIGAAGTPIVGQLVPLAGVGPFDSDPGSDDSGIAARITFSPIHDDYTVYHAGIAARYENLHENANNFNFGSGFEVKARQTPVVFTNIPPNSTDDFNVWGFELAGRWGPLLVQGEYMLANVERDDTFGPFDLRNPPGELDYHGYYVAASYVLTGECREYDFDSGTFGPVHPQSRKGAWEIGVRHSFVDLSDNGLDGNRVFQFIDFVPGNAADSLGNPAVAANNFNVNTTVNDIPGSAHSTTIGLTWWVNDNVRFMANYVRADVGDDQDMDILGLRGQVTW